MNLAWKWDHDRDLRKHWCPDDPDGWRDEAEDKESTDNERDDREGIPAVDEVHGECVPVLDVARATADAGYGARFGDFIGE